MQIKIMLFSNAEESLISMVKHNNLLCRSNLPRRLIILSKLQPQNYCGVILSIYVYNGRCSQGAILLGRIPDTISPVVTIKSLVKYHAPIPVYGFLKMMSRRSVNWYLIIT